MALACEDSRMSLDGSDLSNLSPCKPMMSTAAATANNNSKATPAKTKDEQQSSSSSSSEEEEQRHHGSSIVVATGTQISFSSKHRKEDDDKPKHPHHQVVEVTRLSWVDIVEEADRAEQQEQQQPLKDKEASELVGSETKMSMDDSNSNISMRSNGSGRQIEIDFLDSVNVEKYEKLVRDEKIKSPFKRRLSGGDENEDDDGDEINGGDNDGHAKFIEGSSLQPNQQQHNLHKKTKMNEEDHGRERFRRESSSSSSADGSSQSSRKPIEYEKDLSILERRQKQIDYGKNTLGYENYTKQVPRDKRTKDHPKTPPKHIKYSRRAWDGLVKVWRKQLHCFDPNAMETKRDDPDAKPDADV